MHFVLHEMASHCKKKKMRKLENEERLWIWFTMQASSKYCFHTSVLVESKWFSYHPTMGPRVVGLLGYPQCTFHPVFFKSIFRVPCYVSFAATYQLL